MKNWINSCLFNVCMVYYMIKIIWRHETGRSCIWRDIPDWVVKEYAESFVERIDPRYGIDETLPRLCEQARDELALRRRLILRGLNDK
jgi:hypothetical protein